jgi:hypothetical protein
LWRPRREGDPHGRISWLLDRHDGLGTPHQHSREQIEGLLCAGGDQDLVRIAHHRPRDGDVTRNGFAQAKAPLVSLSAAKSMLGWMSGAFDPEGFDLNAINWTLRFGPPPAAQTSRASVQR